MPSTLRIRASWLALCAAVVVLSSCGSEPYSTRWEEVYDDLPASLYSVWGTSPNDVWAVGGDPDPNNKDGYGPQVLHFDGHAWQTLRTQYHGDLHAVFAFANGPVFMAGANGLILRYQNQRFERLIPPPPGKQNIVSLWGTSAKDLWATGGYEGKDKGGFVWHFDGNNWQVPAGLPPTLVNSRIVRRVWGSGAKDVWFVGTHGVLVHYDGSNFEPTYIPQDKRSDFRAVHGNAQHLFVVGGTSGGVLYEQSSGAWLSVLPTDAPVLNAVFTNKAGHTYVVGTRGNFYSDAYGTGGPYSIFQDRNNYLDEGYDLLALWVDSDGGIWVCGDADDGGRRKRGLLLHKGDNVLEGSSYRN